MTSSWRWLGWGGAGAGLAAVVLWLVSSRVEPAAAPLQAPAQTVGAAALKRESAAVVEGNQMPGSASTEAATGSGLNADELKSLRAELASHPNGEAEVQRVVDYLRFSRQWEAFQAAGRPGADPQAQRAIAQVLDDELPRHWQQAELTGPQALQIKAQLLEVLLPDEDSRRAELMRWRALNQPAPSSLSADASAEFKTEQSRLVAAWRALPPAQRQTAQLHTQLDALRKHHFANTASPLKAQGDRQ